MRATLGIAAVTAVLTGCAGNGDEPARPAERARPATAGPAAEAEGRPARAPRPRSPIPRSPATLSARLSSVSKDLRRAIAAWRSSGPGRRAKPPGRVELLALYQQRAYRLLARRPRLAAATLARLPPGVRAEARDSVGGLRALFGLTSLATESRFRTGPPHPPDVLLGYYRAAQRRFSVDWNVLAAVNMIESNFGRLRNVSNAGAVGPMQFLPSTWRRYGLGGEIRHPRDAILGAANYLRASGAPASHARALYAYNPSGLYVEAVLHFARRIGRDRRAYYAYWSWQSFRRTRAGDVQLTGPGAR